MSTMYVELDRPTFSLHIITSLLIMIIVIAIKILWAGQSMYFPIYYYLMAVFFFAIISTIVFEVLFEVSEVGALVIYISAIFIISELPLPGEFNFLVSTVVITLIGGNIVWLLKTL